MSLDLVRYLVVGIGSNLINFTIYFLLYSVGISLIVSLVVAYSAGLFISYHFGRVWVFGRKNNVSKQNMIRFAVVYFIGGLGMTVLVEILVQSIEIDYRISWLFGASFAVVNNFLGLKWFVFNKKEAGNGN